MKGIKMKKKRGVASFYIVTFSTLILMIITASFATVIISEINRTSNDDLSQSAYDSALAGIEDAKIAFANYQRCLENGYTIASAKAPNNDNNISCEEIIYWMNNPDCDMVGHILGRISETSSSQNGDNTEVSLGSTTTTTGSSETSLNQAYTCVVVDKELDDYRSELTTAADTKIVGIKFNSNEANALSKVRLSWYSINPETPFKFGDTRNGGSEAAFKPKTDTGLIAPPVLEFQLVQTAGVFTVQQLIGHTDSSSTQTDRGTLYLVPKKGNATNTISAKALLDSNNLQVKNLPKFVECRDSSNSTASDYSCTVDIELPMPIGGNRNKDTLLFALSLPYNQPETDFSMEFFCGTEHCGSVMNGEVRTQQLSIHDTQVKIDSTGRANDLFRRVEVRLETQDTSLPYPYYAMQILSNDSDYTVSKDMIVSCEHSLYEWGGRIVGSISNYANCQ